jgi:hypothetical protein
VVAETAREDLVGRRSFRDRFRRRTDRPSIGEALVHLVDESSISQTAGAVRIRRVLATLFLAYGVVLASLSVGRGDLPQATHLILMMMAAALFTNRGGRFVRDWLPVILGILAYLIASSYAQKLDFAVHYNLQIDADRIIGFGTLPTVWLQEHLYHGSTGVLETLAVGAYATHFFAPLALAFYIWWARRPGFTELMFGLLVVTTIAEITFIAVPTAPPWLAAQNGYIPPVHHILKQGLFDLHLTRLAEMSGDPNAYNIVAAVPSLHVAWPIIGLLVIAKYRLSPWAFRLTALQLAAVVVSIVYTGEHYVFDALAAVVYAFVAWAIIQRALGPARRLRRPTVDAGAASPAQVSVSDGSSRAGA